MRALLAQLRSRLAARPDTEHEQALVRLVITLLLVLYLWPDASESGRNLILFVGGAHFALASYNAGESRVVRWRSERPGLDQDEFIDDIPFPETQGYVKKILGTAEDYRHLYGPGASSAADDDDARPAVSHQSAPATAKKASATTTSSNARKKPAAKSKARPVKKKAPAQKKRSA